MRFQTQEELSNCYKPLYHRVRMVEAVLQAAKLDVRDMNIAYFPDIHIPVSELYTVQLVCEQFGNPSPNAEFGMNLDLNYFLGTIVVGTVEKLTRFWEVIQNIPIADYLKMKDQVRRNFQMQENLVSILEGYLNFDLLHDKITGYSKSNPDSYRKHEEAYHDYFEEYKSVHKQLAEWLPTIKPTLELCKDNPQLISWRTFCVNSPKPWYFFGN